MRMRQTWDAQLTKNSSRIKHSDALFVFPNYALGPPEIPFSRFQLSLLTLNLSSLLCILVYLQNRSALMLQSV